MKLLIICGPPASGKLTIASEIANKTDFKVFHNHKSIDIYQEILGYESKDFWKSVNKFRLDIIKLAAKNNINLLFTFCYADGNEWFFDKIKTITNKFNSELCIVKLTCNKDELSKRVISKSRLKYNKIHDTKTLNEALIKNDFYSEIKKHKVLTINNTNKTVRFTVEKIISHFNIKSVM